MTKTQVVQIRVTDEEKQGFADAAELAGGTIIVMGARALALGRDKGIGERGQKNPFCAASPITHG